MMGPIIRIEDVTLWRRTQEEFHYDLKRAIFALLERRYRKPSRRRVLDRVSIRVGAGEKIALIGANGSGKSTLLKVLCGILRPTTGRVHVSGRVAPLIELGAGFDPELSLVDNILYYGILLGFPKLMMESRIDAILDFAELTDHRNEPVKALSSGMTARLGFAIATDVRPEILVLDEVLSVGDERFRRKCQERIDRFWDAHSTIVVVSHDLDFVARSCDRAVWLDSGRVLYDGGALEATLRYRASVDRDASMEAPETSLTLLMGSRPHSRHGDRVYLLVNGVKRWILDPRWLLERRLDAGHAIVLADDVLDRIPDGEPIAYEEKLELEPVS